VILTKTIVADSKYGSAENYLYCEERGIQAHMPDLREKTEKKRKREVFSTEEFTYDSELDAFICPAGGLLKKHAYHKNNNH